MKTFFAAAALLLVSGASIPYFKYSRDVQAGGSAPQSYIVVDETVWQHARPDLSDLRLYAGQTEVPYALTVQQGSSSTEQKDVRVLQPGTSGGKTQFFLDMAGLAEYDHIALRLKTRNFVAKVKVEGQDDLHGAKWATLADTIFYDLSDDNLGGNSTLRLPLTTYKYLRVTLDGPVKPGDIESATADIKEEEKTAWRNVGQLSKQEQQGKDTVFTFSVPKNVPVERLEFSIDAAQPNFRRDVTIEDANGKKVRWSDQGEITRVHMVRHGQKIDFEQSDLRLPGSVPETLHVIVHNGDDPPLKITSVRLQQYERRLYFNSPGAAPNLYYGDEKLDAPVYDYSKLFQKDAKAVPAQLGPEQTNTAYTGRPDDRPWSDRHPAVLWVAIIGAVVILGALALRSMKTAAAAKAP